MKNKVTKLFKITMALVMTVFSSVLVNAREGNGVTFLNYYRSDRELINSFPRMIAVDAPFLKKKLTYSLFYYKIVKVGFWLV